MQVDLITRAPAADAQTIDTAMAVGGSEEPFMGDSAPDEGGQDADPLVVREGVYGRLG